MQRLALMANVLSLRHELREAGLDYYGDPSAIVCVKMGTEGLARLVSKRLPELGLIANLVEFPAVPKGAARIRMQVMANHSVQNIADAVEILKTARQQAELQFEDINRPASLAAAVPPELIKAAQSKNILGESYFNSVRFANARRSVSPG